MADRDIAIIMVTYKSALLAVESLRSVQIERTASALRTRVIVVDNASGDFPVIARSIEENGWSSWITLVAAPRNGGFAYGNNLGLEHAYVESAPSYVYLLNPDSQVRPGAISSLVHFLEGHPNVGIAGGSFENPDGSEWPIAFRFPTIFSELDSGLCFGLITRLLRHWVVARRMSSVAQPVDWISGASMMIRSTVIATIGGLDENFFLYFEETDFCRRAKRVGFHTWYVPESRVMHIGGQSTRVADQSVTSRRLPHYWFESRRRYFALTFGIHYAMIIDVVAVLAHSLGLMKRIALGRARTTIPHFIRDLLRHSVLWPHNRTIPRARCFLPPSKEPASAFPLTTEGDR